MFSASGWRFWVPTECHQALFWVLGGKEPTGAAGLRVGDGPGGPAKAMALAPPGASRPKEPHIYLWLG